MNSSTLRTLLAPFKQMVNTHALSSAYRTLKLTPETITAQSGFGVMSAQATLGITEECYVDAAVFLTVMESLPENQNVKLKINKGNLDWSCGQSKGRIASVVIENFPELERTRNKKRAWQPPLEFAEALELGALSCESSTLATIGMYGVVIDNRDGLCVYSSDNSTVSACAVGSGDIKVAAMPKLVTLLPEAAGLLVAVLKTATDAWLEFSEKDVFLSSENMTLLVAQSAPLQQDIAKILEQYLSGETSVEIPPQRVQAFIKRVGALAESKKHIDLFLHIKEGRIALSFSEGVASADEYYLAEALKGVKNFAPVAVGAASVARALRYIQEIIVDYVERHVIVLRGESPTFYYMVAGKPSSDVE